MASITLSDGTIIDNLTVNGDNFISTIELTPEMFFNKLSPVTIETEELGSVIHEHMDLVQITHPDDNWWFVLRDLTDFELQQIKIRSDVDFIAMMTDVDLDDME